MSRVGVVLVVLVLSVSLVRADHYLLYCPCMGRFGNQADQFLGTLAFSAGLGRTLVIPPWISYSSRSNNINLITWDSVFNITTLSNHQPVITMENFMTSVASSVWPEGARTSLCYSSRPGAEQKSCNAKHGSPFGPFWDSFQISFDRSEMFAPLNFNTSPENLRGWRDKYPGSEFPVLAMTGAPASFPVRSEHLHLQRYVTWTEEWEEKGQSWVTTNMGPGVEYIAIHLRNGLDWSKACDHTETGGLANLFSSAQCLGYSNQRGQLSRELCLPSQDTVITQLQQIITQTGFRHVFVASDNDYMIEKLSKIFSDKGVSFFKQSQTSEDGFLLDLVILTQSNHFIGNCVSSFSAFVTRTREVQGLSTSFWTFSLESDKKKTEL